MCDKPECGKSIIRGAIGLTKVAMQDIGIPIDQAPEKDRLERIEKCRLCPHSEKDPAFMHEPHLGLTNKSKCTLCTCRISKKVRVASESCPIGVWPAVASE